MLCAISADGTESQSYGSWTTCYSLDALLTKHDAQHLLREATTVELVLI